MASLINPKHVSRDSAMSLPCGISARPLNSYSPQSLLSIHPLLSHLGSCLSQVRHGLWTTKCIQEKGSGQTNHRQISSSWTQLGSTSRFFQNSITVWVMTGSAGSQSYLDYCGATVIEFEGCPEQWWNIVHWATVATVRAPKGWREDRVVGLLIVHAHTYSHTYTLCQQRLL